MVYNKSEIARKTGLTRQTVVKIFNGVQKNPKLETLQKIAKTLNCTVDDLLASIKKDVVRSAKNCTTSSNNKVT